MSIYLGSQGEDFCFDSGNQATDILGLLMRHWGTISSELFQTLKEPHVYMPVLLEDDDEEPCTRQRLGTRLYAWRSSTPGELARVDRQR